MVRVTQTILNNATLFNLQNTMGRVARIQDQLSSGLRINKPSDDPAGFAQSLALRTNIHMGRGYLNNIQNARSNLELSETGYGGLTEALRSVRSLAVRAANEDNDPQARVAMADQVREYARQILDIANSNFNGQYIYGGSETQKTPFVGRDGTILYRGDDLTREVPIGKNNRIGSNLHGYQGFIHTRSQAASSVRVGDVNAPLAEQLRLAHAEFPFLPPQPSANTGADAERSPNPDNSPSPRPNNLAEFSIYGKTLRVDLAVDSLEDVKNRINLNVPDVTATIDESNRLVIASNRADALQFEDGPRPIGYGADPPYGSNLLTALGITKRIEGGRPLTRGYPAHDPLIDPFATPVPGRNTVRVEPASFLFAGSHTGPARTPAVPFADNLSLTETDREGIEILDGDGNPNFIEELQAIRVIIDGEAIDIDLRALTRGRDFDGTPGNGDDVPGSTLGDLVDLLNNHPLLGDKATAFVTADGTGIGLAASSSVESFEVQEARKLFGRDIATRAEADPNTGEIVITRTDTITADTELDDLPGALVDENGESLGIRRRHDIPGLDEADTNFGLVTVSNNGVTDTVDLREAATVGDVLRAFNESKAGVRAEINEFGTGINVVSLNGESSELRIRDMEEGTAARDLGLFSPPAPARVSSTNANPLDAAQLVSDPDAAPNAGDGEFVIEIRGNGGEVLDTYTIEVTANGTLGDLVARIDAADGETGPGGGLFSANLEGGRLNIVSHYDGHAIFIDPARDTTGADAATRFTAQMGLNPYTATREEDIPSAFYTSNQNTAHILGLAGEGTADEVEGRNVFRSVDRLETALRNDDTEGIQQALEDLDIDLEHVLEARSTAGARMNRLDAAQIRLEDAEDLLRQDLSLNEDADLAELITEFTMAQNAFNAALQASSRILQQSLINFLG